MGCTQNRTNIQGTKKAVWAIELLGLLFVVVSGCIKALVEV